MDRATVGFGLVLTSRRFASRGSVFAAVAFALATGCHGGPNAVLVELTESSRLVADLRVQFNKASDASNRSVMADTDEASIAYAREAEQVKGVVKADVAALGPHLRSLGYAAETKLLADFETHLAEYEKLDHSILELAIENTNLKAQRLSFGPAREAADAFRDALDTLTRNPTLMDRCRVESLVAKAELAVREIQVLQAPHIAAAEDSVMTRLELEMSALEVTARDVVSALTRIADPKARAQVAMAEAALDRLRGVSGEIVKLSRRNSNVRSLELSLRRKPAATAACDESLRGLQDALARITFTATR